MYLITNMFNNSKVSKYEKFILAHEFIVASDSNLYNTNDNDIM